MNHKEMVPVIQFLRKTADGKLVPFFFKEKEVVCEVTQTALKYLSIILKVAFIVIRISTYINDNRWIWGQMIQQIESLLITS